MAINPKDLFMLCESIPTNDKEQLQEYCENKSYIQLCEDKQAIQDITLCISGIDKAKIEELIEL